MRTGKFATATRLPNRAVVSTFQSISSSREPGHLDVLDGVRGLAILLVLVFHLTLGMVGQGLVGRLLFKLTGIGWCGVDLFFVLSGFLITGILHDAKSSPHRFRNFYARRALRIFPLYYMTLAVILAILPITVGLVGQFEDLRDARFWLWTYGTNIHIALRGDWFPLSHFWSLAVEEHFYIFWPAIIFGCPRSTALRVCAGMILTALVVRSWLVIEGAVLGGYCLTVCRMDALAMGGFIALAMREPTRLDYILPIARKILVISVAALAVVAVSRLGLFLLDPVVQIVGYTLLDLFFAASLVLVLSAAERSWLAIVFRSFLLRLLGRYSYGIYVFNSIFLLIAERLHWMIRLVDWSGSTILGYLLYVLTGSLTTFLVAWLSWHLLEKQFLKLKSRFCTQTVLMRPDLASAFHFPVLSTIDARVTAVHS